ncbi:MAG: hypothetical protein IPM29_06550 [Planctomycetes bacterium]|nr:hypothetical protein [Planctomycetota bacterium]
MLTLVDLWLPVLVAAVFVFVASSVIHMALPIHSGDMAPLPDEDRIADAMREAGVTPGHYMFPFPASMKEMGSPEMLAKFQRGPVGFLIVRPKGGPAIGKALLQWFVLSVVVSACCGYVATIGLGSATASGDVFRLTATVALLAYGGAIPNDALWKGGRWSVALRFLFDALVYGLVTGAAFAWLWPAAS